MIHGVKHKALICLTNMGYLAVFVDRAPSASAEIGSVKFIGYSMGLSILYQKSFPGGIQLEPVGAIRIEESAADQTWANLPKPIGET